MRQLAHNCDLLTSPGISANGRLHDVVSGALLDRLAHHVHILEMNGDSYRLTHSKRRSSRARLESPPGDALPPTDADVRK